MDTKEIDNLVRQAVFGQAEEKNQAQNKIWELAGKAGIWSASIRPLYGAMGRGEVAGFTVPAMNLRGIVYDSARAAFKVAGKRKAGAFIFELARSEMGYTFQNCQEYAIVVIAAAIREGYTGPVFIQGDHYQVNVKKFAAGGAERDKEIQALKDLIAEAIAGGYRNIDIDSSTVVDLDKSSIKEQQFDNYENTAQLAAHIRSVEPAGVTVSIGGEIGEVGKKNSTPDEFRAFMDGFNEEFEKLAPGKTGLSKVSVQTGTTHGGVVLPDGSIAKVSIDFGVLKKISDVARGEYKLAGAVQHGASTLPAESFDEFPKSDAAEVHLATEFQNILMDHPAFSTDLKKEMYAWLDANCADERKPDWTPEQFYYKTRKKAWGPFKAQAWDMPEDKKVELRKALEDKMDLLFGKLGVAGSKTIVKKYVKPL